MQPGQKILSRPCVHQSIGQFRCVKKHNAKKEKTMMVQFSFVLIAGARGLTRLLRIPNFFYSPQNPKDNHVLDEIRIHWPLIFGPR